MVPGLNHPRRTRPRSYSTNLRVVFGSYVLSAEAIDRIDDKLVVEVRKPLAPGATVSLIGDVRTPDRQIELRVGAHVARCEPSDQGGFHVALSPIWSDVTVDNEKTAQIPMLEWQWGGVWPERF
jgi:hypothetical protein